MYDPIFPINVGRVSACSPYRELRRGETTEEYVARLAQELDNKFRELGPETVCAFIIEPVSGSVSAGHSVLIVVMYAKFVSLGPWLHSCCAWLSRGYESCVRSLWRSLDLR